MIPLEAARAALLAGTPRLPAQEAPAASAAGRWLAADARAALDLPRFAAAAMDGYALRAADTAAAAAAAPARLAVTGRVPAGAAGDAPVQAGTAVRVFTGAPLPAGADAVVMQEDVEPTADGALLVREPVRPWENVRLRGEDVRAGAVLRRAGERITPGAVGALLAAGVAAVSVAARPRVLVLATGDELRAAGQPLAAGQIYESNRGLLAALLAGTGAVVTPGPILPDDLAATREGLAAALAEADVVVTSGGVSVGEADLVRAAWRALGGVEENWRVAIKPGKPVAWGRHGERRWFGLPGNPVSAAVTALLLVAPVLRAMQGAADPLGPRWPGTLAAPLANRGDRRHFLRVRRDPAGRWESAGRQASHALASLAAAEGLVDVPPETTLPAGTAVEVWPLE